MMIHTEKTFNKIQLLLMIKTLSKVGIEGTCLSIIKAMYDKAAYSYILNGEKLKAFSLRSGKRQGHLLSPVLFNIVLEVFATVINEKQKALKMERKK